MMKKYIGVAMVVALLLAGLQLLQAASAGSVSGKVTFKGNPPPLRKLVITSDTSVCGTEQHSEDAVVGPDKGVKHAVVHLIGVKGAAAEIKPVALEQKGCKFTPHVLVVPKGTEFDILNHDGISHNLHTQSTANPEINKSQPGFKKKISQKFEQAEKIKLSCDVHPWMRGWIVVADDPFVVVTDETGSFKLPNVPAGTYKLEVWHERFGTQIKDVTVKPAGDSSVTFELGG